jgi:hypothetical protein
MIKFARVLFVLAFASQAIAAVDRTAAGGPVQPVPVGAARLSIDPVPGFPSLELGAIRSALSAGNRDIAVSWNGNIGRIELVGPTAAAAGRPAAAIEVGSARSLQSKISELNAHLDRSLPPGAEHDPEAVGRSLAEFFDAAAPRRVNPFVRTTQAMASSFSLPLDASSKTRTPAAQKAALKAWQNSPRRTYVIVNSYSYRDDGTPGLKYYDTRGLAQILWAADPNVDVIYLSAIPFDKAMVDHVLQGRADADEIRRRVHFVTTNDDSNDFLTQKLLDSKHAATLTEVRDVIAKIGSPAVLYPYMYGPLEAEVARRLEIPNAVYGMHPSLAYWGTKSGGRRIFKAVIARYQGTRKATVRLADGVGDIYDMPTLVKAVERIRARHLKRTKTELPQIAERLNLGSSGEGNFFPKISDFSRLSEQERAERLRQLNLEKAIGIENPKTGRIDTFVDAMAAEGAEVAAYIPGIETANFPSVQWEIGPDGVARIVSSHEQILIDRNTYIGADYKANRAYRKVLETVALETARELAKKGVVGPGGTDFAAVPQKDGGWDLYLIENNIRMTGTKYPLITAQGLTGATQDSAGVIRRPQDGAEVSYRTSDHDLRPNLAGLGVVPFLEFFDRPENHRVLFDRASLKGAMFHLLAAVQFDGNVGYTLIGSGVSQVRELQRQVSECLDRLEIERITGIKAENLQRRAVARDLREQINAKIGHAKQEKEFRAFLALHPEVAYSPASGRGIIFHPVGYSAIGRNQGDIEEMGRAARRLLAEFKAKAI